MPPIFVVSLVREAERRARMRKELKAQQLDFEFFDAVDGAGLTEDCCRRRMHRTERSGEPTARSRPSTVRRGI